MGAGTTTADGARGGRPPAVGAGGLGASLALGAAAAAPPAAWTLCRAPPCHLVELDVFNSLLSVDSWGALTRFRPLSSSDGFFALRVDMRTWVGKNTFFFCQSQAKFVCVSTRRSSERE